VRLEQVDRAYLAERHLGARQVLALDSAAGCGRGTFSLPRRVGTTVGDLATPFTYGFWIVSIYVLLRRCGRRREALGRVGRASRRAWSSWPSQTRRPGRRAYALLSGLTTK
jgi:hypothetical protein